jgi:hypothetical protein
MGWLEWIDLAQDRDQWTAVVSEPLGGSVKWWKVFE